MVSKNPFQPHRIARLRLGAYQKTVVMKYIDNLIAWGDQLFARDSVESINEATQLYILAYNVLGPRPERIPELTVSTPKTYHDLQTQLDGFSNVLVDVQNSFPYVIATSAPSTGGSAGANGLGLGRSLYFGIPRNDKLLGYWDTVEDRLFKIRHGLNIEGMARTLPLFEAPIDPALLVQAAAAGVDLGAVLSDLNAPLGYYRFSYLLPKAVELCAEVKSLGVALLAALEKKDAEALSNLRASQETVMLRLARQVKEQQVHEATATREGLEKTQAVTERRHAFYKDIVFMTPWEITGQVLSAASMISQGIGVGMDLAASLSYVAPQVDVGMAGVSTPVIVAEYGGQQAGNSTRAWAELAKGAAGILNTSASMASTMGSFWRRQDECRSTSRSWRPRSESPSPSASLPTTTSRLRMPKRSRRS